MKNFTFMWIAALAALVAGPALAEMNDVGKRGEGAKSYKRAMRVKGESGKHRERKGIGHGLAGELGLSSNKTEEIQRLMKTTRQDMIKLREARDQARNDLNRLFKADPLDEKAILAAAEKLAQVNAELTMTMAKGRLAVNASLAPEQRTRMHELRQKTMKRFKERGKEHGRKSRFGEDSKAAPDSQAMPWEV